MLVASFPLRTSSKILNFFYDFLSEKLEKVSNKNPVQPQTFKTICTQIESPSTQLQPTPTSTFSSCEFLSAITHELKTPLSAIISMAEILAENLAAMSSENLSAAKLEKNSELFAESKSFVADIATITADMLSLVHDILDVSKVSSGNLSGRFSVNLDSEIDLHDVVKRAVKLNYDYSLKRNVTIKVEISDEVKLVKLDAKRMKQIFTNLISNAVKYSPAGGEVRVTIKNIYHNCETGFVTPSQCSVQNKDDMNMQTGLQTPSGASSIQITIADQGFGMTQSQIQTAFQKFQTIENPNSGSVDSFGLGLPITKQLVELQGGEIFVESKVGEGTRMKIIFPEFSSSLERSSEDLRS